MSNMLCNVLDLRCVLVSELIGSPTLTILLLGALFFMFCSLKRVGIKTTLWLSVVFFPVVTYYIAGSSAGLAFITAIVAIVAALLHGRIIGNR